MYEFLKVMLKYTGIASDIIGMLGIPGLVVGTPILTSTLLGTTAAPKNITKEHLENAQISISEILKFIGTPINI